MRESLEAIDAIRLNFSSNSQMIINVALAIIMFGVALGLRLSGFKRVFKRPKLVLVGLTSQLILLPAFTFVLVYLLRDYITASVAMGMILVASCPGGNISNFMSSLAKANTELSITLTSITTLAAVFTTPFNFAFWGNLYAKTSDLVRPLHIPFLEMFKIVMLLLGIPMALGLLFAWKFPKQAEKLKKPFRWFGIIFFLLLIVMAFAANFTLFVKHIKYIFLLVLFHNAMAISIGYFFSTAMGLKHRDRRTIAIETGIQNSGLALVLIFNPKIFPPDLNMGGMMFIAGWWGIWHIISGLTLAKYWLHKDIRRYNKITKIRGEFQKRFIDNLKKEL